MSIALPTPASDFFAATNSATPERVADCFEHDATVVDEGHTYRGLDAIRAWQRAAKEKFDFTSEPVGMTRHGDTLTVTARVVGNFPGSPANLDHVFRFSGEKIRSLEIG